MDVGSRVRTGLRWMAVGRATAQVYTWTLTILTMSLLEPNDYGLLAIAAIFVSFLSLFEELGLRTRLIQMREVSQDYVRSVYGLSILTNGALTLTLVVLSPLIAWFFNQTELTYVIIVLALQFMIQSLGVIPDAMIKRRLDYPKTVMVEFCQAVSAATVTLILAAHGFGVWSLVGGTIIGTLVRTSGLLLVSPFKKWPSFAFIELGPTLRFGGIITAQRVMWWAYNSLDRFIIGRVFDAHTLGLYSVSAQIALMPLDKVGSTLNMLSFTGLARTADNPEMFQRYLIRACRLVALVLFPLFVGIAALAPEIVPIVFGDRWIGMELIMPILAFSVPARCLSLPLMESLNSQGRPFEHLKCTAFTASAFASGILLGLPWHLEGIAFGVVGASIISYLNVLRVVKRNSGISPLLVLAQIWKPGLAALAMFAVLKLTRPYFPAPFPSIEGLLATVFLGGLTYVALIVLFDRTGLHAVLDVIRPNPKPSSRTAESPALKDKGRNGSDLPRQDPVGFSQTPHFSATRKTIGPNPLLTIMIDVEEDFDWTRPFSRENHSVDSLGMLPRVHEIFRRHGVVPTYLVDYPIIKSALGARLFREWHDKRECIVGTQLHPWVNPPFDEEICEANSYAGNLPRELERSKLELLTKEIETAIGVRPVIYRAGRYGLGRNSLQTIEELGYQIDTSVVPNTDLGHNFGPDYSSYSFEPFWFGQNKRLLEIPLTRGFTGPLRMLVPLRHNLFDRSPLLKLRITGILARLGLLQRVTLTPEGITLAEMKRLTRESIEDGQQFFSFSFHSPSLMPGCTPYVSTDAEATQFLKKIDEYLEYFIKELGGKCITPFELREGLAGTEKTQTPRDLASI